MKQAIAARSHDQRDLFCLADSTANWEVFNKLDEEWEKGQKLNLCKGVRETYLPWINIRSFHSQTARLSTSLYFYHSIHTSNEVQHQIIYHAITISPEL